MRHRPNLSTLSLVMVVVCGLNAQEVVRCPQQSPSLSDRWTWASGDGSRSINAKEYWVGYSVKRMMNEDSFISSGNFYSGNGGTRRSLHEVISGEISGQSGGDKAWGGSKKNKIFKVRKDVAILFAVSGELDAEGAIRRFELSNMELSVDLKNKPLLWLGEAEDEQSVSLLKGLFDRHTSNDLRKSLVMAIGIHQNAKQVFPFLADVLKSDKADDIRSQAAFWLGQQDLPESLTLLTSAAQDDRSAKVREQSVFAVSQLSSDESLDALINLSRKAKDSKIRGKAVFWLGQKASQKAVATLESIIEDDETTDVQRQALYALAQIRTSEGVDRLIKIARTHTNPRIRKQAIQCLGQSDDPKALEALIAIVRN
jgi:HEAT repeat protein